MSKLGSQGDTSVCRRACGTMLGPEFKLPGHIYEVECGPVCYCNSSTMEGVETEQLQAATVLALCSVRDLSQGDKVECDGAGHLTSFCAFWMRTKTSSFASPSHRYRGKKGREGEGGWLSTHLTSVLIYFCVVEMHILFCMS